MPAHVAPFARSSHCSSCGRHWEYCPSCGVQGCRFARHLIAGRVPAFCRLNCKLGFLIHLGWKQQNCDTDTVILPVLTAVCVCVEVEGSALNKPNAAAASLHRGGPRRPRPAAAQGQCLAGQGLPRFNILPEGHGLQTRPRSQVPQDGRVVVNDQNGVNWEDFLEGAP